MAVRTDGGTSPAPMSDAEKLAAINQARADAGLPPYATLEDAQNASGGSGGKPPTLVYMGTKPVPGQVPADFGPGAPRTDRTTEPGTVQAPDFQTQSQALYWLQNLYFNDRASYDKIVDKMVRAGLLDSKAAMNFGDVYSKWQGLVGLAMDAYDGSGGKAHVSPMDFLDKQVGANSAAAGGTTTYSGTNTSFASPSQVQGAYRSITANELGRGATDAEDRLAYEIVHGQQAAHPETQKSTSRTDAKGNTVASSTTTGGPDVQEILTQQAEAAPDHAEYQSATTYLAAAMSVLAAANNAGA